jgi:Golgi SNAP receptor complex protein 1
MGALSSTPQPRGTRRRSKPTPAAHPGPVSPPKPRNQPNSANANSLLPITSPNPSLTSGGWDELRREARRLEGELDGRLAAYARLAAGFESGAALRGGSGADASSSSSLLATDQAARQRAAEVEQLLQRLADVNEELAVAAATTCGGAPGGAAGGGASSKQHVLARHRDVLAELRQEFRRAGEGVSAARERAELLSGGYQSRAGGEGAALLGGGGNSDAAATAALLRERGTIAASTNLVDEMLAQAGAVSRGLADQRRAFESVGDRLAQMGERFPAVHGLLNAVRRKKSRDTVVLAGVIASCAAFTIIYVLAK